MPLLLDDKYKVVLDASGQNYQLEKYMEIKERDTGDTKYDWKSIGFHGLSLKSVLNQYTNQKIADLVANENLEASTLSNKLDELKSQINSISGKLVHNE